ncbi:MAG TPA: Rnf-Nqr domain containing protein [Rectinemataceae bacterium]|nr:Rnf-Nqr domain containing protein [Rectinemataceae bacterium]
MSYIGLVLSAVFAANSMLVYGFGRLPRFRAVGAGWLPPLLALVLVNALASTIFWAIRNLVLVPLGLASIDLFVFVLLAVPLIKSLTHASTLGEGFLARVGIVADELVVGTLSFGVALIVSRGGYRIVEALIASAASGLGYWLAAVVLERIEARLELSSVPDPFRGAPVMIVSTGLIAMALMGIDASFVRNLVGR